MIRKKIKDLFLYEIQLLTIPALLIHDSEEKAKVDRLCLPPPHFA